MRSNPQGAAFFEMYASTLSTVIFLSTMIWLVMLWSMYDRLVMLLLGPLGLVTASLLLRLLDTHDS